MMNLKKLFNPRAVAVLGAADDPTKLGYVLMDNLIKNKKLKVYPVNPAFKKVLGLRCLPSVKNITRQVDLAVIAVKPEIVPIVLKECGEKKIPHAIIITAGYKETGPEGEAREKELKTIAKKYRINLVGPNCLGVMDTWSGLNASFGNDLPAKGSVAFVSQSGAIGTAMLDWASKNNLKLSKFVSIGNEAGATENDFLEYLGKDEKTKAILLYLEGITDGRRFVRLAKKITRRKPVLVLKAGVSERGLKAVSSHTGSLAPSYEIFKTACRAGGVILVESLGAMFSAAKMFANGFFRAPSDWVVFTNGGGPSIVTADLIELSPNLKLSSIPENIKNKLRKVLPSSAAVNNPVDIIGDALKDRYEAALKILVAEKSIGGIIMILTPQKMTQIKETAELVVKYNKIKPIIPLFIGGTAVEAAEKVFAKHNLVNFTDPQALVKIISAMAPQIVKTASPSAAPSDKAGTTRQMRFDEMAMLMSKYKLAMSGNFVNKKESLARYSGKVPFPWVMKISSEQIVHKTEMSGVKLNIASLAEAKLAWDEMSAGVLKKVPGAKIDGFVVQPMVKGTEVIIGMKRDPNFGPVIIFGLGGIFVEILKDVSMRLAPVDENEALLMINEIKSAAVLKGARGGQPVDVAALAKIIVAVSKLAIKEKSIAEIDLNPVMATAEGVEIVDARIMVNNKPRK